MMITDDDESFVLEVLAFCPSAFRGGSYVIKGRDAGDIDVVIPHADWPRVRDHFAGRIEKVLRERPVELEAEIEEDERLVCVYRRGAVDLIVVSDMFVESYRFAIRDIVADPDRYAERPARVAIHVFYADEVRVRNGMLTEAEIRAKRGGTRSEEYEANKAGA